jgi:hypothetical protein
MFVALRDLDRRRAVAPADVDDRFEQRRTIPAPMMSDTAPPPASMVSNAARSV